MAFDLFKRLARHPHDLLVPHFFQVEQLDTQPLFPAQQQDRILQLLKTVFFIILLMQIVPRFHIPHSIFFQFPGRHLHLLRAPELVQAMIPGNRMKPGLEGLYVVLLQSGEKVLEDMHDGIFRLLLVFKVFQADKKNKTGVPPEQLSHEVPVPCFAVTGEDLIVGERSDGLRVCQPAAFYYIGVKISKPYATVRVIKNISIPVMEFKPAGHLPFKNSHSPLNQTTMKTKGKTARSIVLAILFAVSAFAISMAAMNRSANRFVQTDYPGGNGKGILSGIVTEAVKGQPLTAADITLLDPSGLTLMKLVSDWQGHFSFTGLMPGKYTLTVTTPGYRPWVKKDIPVDGNKATTIVVRLKAETVPANADSASLIQEQAVVSLPLTGSKALDSKRSSAECAAGRPVLGYAIAGDYETQEFNTESYDKINENTFKDVLGNPLSTFSIDVDRASYSNVRRFLNNNTLPYKDAVRIEELINYFDYDYPQPVNGDPFSVTLEMGDCPWNKEHNLVLIGIKGKEMETMQIPPSNLVFLLDVSGSMEDENKLPLLKQAFKILVNNLRAVDRVAIVVYAGAAGVILESTPGNEKTDILSALNQLQAGGSTAGGEGINLAYRIAKQNYIPGGNNRVILATDGDFNIGASSDGEMTRLIEEKRKDGVFLTVLGFGMGNYKDSKMEKIADAGNGNYAYIDNILEAKKMFGQELWGTLFTIAKDVKIQVEFNPSKVKAYRLIGYENRMLSKEDFNDDKKDAGDIGSGHTVTALYEIVPAASGESFPNVDPLEYQTSKVTGGSNMMTVKLRYKNPEDTVSRLIVSRVKESDLKQAAASANLRFASSVAEFGMLLRGSDNKGNSNWDQVIAIATETRGKDAYGYRQDFLHLAQTAALLSK
jgi:Ca-activated chloride channel homolog